MASTYSNLKIQLMATGENASTWGDVTNTNLGTAVEEAIAGSADVTFASGNVTLTLSDTNGTQQARNMRLNLIGTTGGSTRNLVVPSIEKAYIVNNTCADSVVVKTAAGSGVTVPAGKTMWVYNNATSVVDAITHITSLTLGSPLPVASGGTGSNTGSGAALTNLNASNVSSGTLAVTYGGTGGTTAATARVNLLPSYTGNGGKVLALNTGATDTEWISVAGAGTVTSVNAATAISGLSFTGGPITAAGTLTLSGTLNVQGGGTGTTSFTSGAVLIGAGTSAVTTVSPGTSGNVLVSNGSAWISQAGGTSGVSSLTAGTGISLSGSTGAITVTNTGVTSVGSTGTVNGITLSGTVTSTGSLTLGGTLSGVSLTSQVSGTLPAGNGGTGITTPGTAGNVLTSNGSAWVSSAVTASGTFAANDGTVSAPSIYFANSSTTGYFSAGGILASAVDGVRAMYVSSSTSANPVSATCLGVNAGTGINGQNCVAIGASAISGPMGASSGVSCTAVGFQALRIVTGAQNTALGSGAGFSITSGSNLTCIGHSAAASSATATNEITLGNSSVATLRCQVTTITSLSDARDKKDVAPLDAGLDFINALNPVRFTWNMRPEEDHEGNMVQGRKDDPDTGFIAQDLKAVQEATGIVIPGLVHDNNPDKLEAGYGKLLPVLVKAIQELSAKVEALEAQLGG
jgi:hypothetical protein